MLEALRNAQVVPCDEAPFRFLGLSMAGYNALLSAGLAILAGLGLHRFTRMHPTTARSV
jgi:disulfide bond formation protein DsbB